MCGLDPAAGALESAGLALAGYISKFEVTNAQYVELLNAKASTDPLELYIPDMGSDPQGGITRSGTIGSYTYAAKPGFADEPVNYVSFFDALRFTNWLASGQGSGEPGEL